VTLGRRSALQKRAGQIARTGGIGARTTAL